MMYDYFLAVPKVHLKVDDKKKIQSSSSLTFTLGPASALNSMMSSGFCTKDRATQSIERVRANSRSLWREGGRERFF